MALTNLAALLRKAAKSFYWYSAASMDSRILETLKELYGFSDPQPLPGAASGFSGSNFLVLDGEVNYFVKRYHFFLTTDEIREIHAVKFLYKSNDIPAITPLHNINKESFFVIGNYHYAVFPYVIGKSFAVPSARAVASMGENLARQHFVSMNHLDVLKNKKEFKGWNEAEFMEDTNQMLARVAAAEPKTDFDIEAEAFIRQKVSIAARYPTRFEELDLRNEYIIHGDFHQYNVFFSEDDTVSHVFDFERVARGPRAVDVVSSLFTTCFYFAKVGGASLEEQYRLAESYLAGYHQTYPLIRRELEDAITWYFLGDLARTHWIEGEWYVGKNPRVKVQLPDRRAWVTYFAENFDHIKERLMGYVFPE